MRIGVVAVGSSGEETQKQVEISPTESIGDLYKKVAQALEKRPQDFKLTYNEKPLTDKDQKISTLGMKEGDTVYASIVAEGGALKNAIKRLMDLPSYFFKKETYEQLSHFQFSGQAQESVIIAPKSEIEWLNMEYAKILRHQPAVRAIDLRHYFFDFKASAGPYQGLPFRLHMYIVSPYDPPIIYCENPYNHPNFHYNGALCIRSPWNPFGSIWEYLERVKFVVNKPNYNSLAR